MVARRFKPRYIFDYELGDYGLPDANTVTDIMTMVDKASILIDEHCGRTDGNGNGSLSYTTYMERLPVNENRIRVTFRPMAVVDATTISDLQLSGSIGTRNNFYTGVMANTIVMPNTSVSPLLGLSGSYGYPKKYDRIYMDAAYGWSLQGISSIFGGLPGFYPVDVTTVDFDNGIGHIWIPLTGIYGQRFKSSIVVYNSGFDPRNMPEQIKQSCAAIVANAMPTGFTTGLKSMRTRNAASMVFNESLIDNYVADLLDRFKVVQM